MITAARLALDQQAAGLPAEFSRVPAWQWDAYFAELSPVCPDRLQYTGERILQRNALRIEIMPEDRPRCARLNPDGRGLAWARSGGSPYAYGQCHRGACQRAGART